MSETVLRCQCCGLPFARLQGSVLIVQSKHHGEQHTNVVQIEEITKQVEANKN